MNIQKINTFNAVAFKKRRKNDNPNKQNGFLSCSIVEKEEQGQKQIVITINKKQLIDFTALLFSKLNIFNNDSNKLTTQTTPENNTPEEANPVIKEPIFPSPKFTSNPSVSQRDEYVNELLKYMNSTPNTKLQLKALKEIEKYGISDVDDISTMILSDDESVIREILKIYQQHAPSKKAYDAIEPIVGDIKIKEDETFIEVLKTIQKLAHLQNDDPKDREIILKPVRRLLNHQSESVRKMAQETLDKLNQR